MLTDDLINAIGARRLVRFRYHDCERLVEPHDLGIAGGVEQLLAYQIGGESRSGSLPEWRRFDVPIRRFLDAGLLETSDDTLRLTSRGVLLSNEIFQEFLT